MAEADAAHDPESMQMVIEQSWHVTMVGLDVTDDTLFRPSHLQAEQTSTSVAARIVSPVTPFFTWFYEPILGQYACTMHSPLTVAVAAHPDLVTDHATLPMSVELTGGLTLA